MIGLEAVAVMVTLAADVNEPEVLVYVPVLEDSDETFSPSLTAVTAPSAILAVVTLASVIDAVLT
jgi:hypothetical protein